MISVDDIILPDTEDTSCGITTHLINQDINFDNRVSIFSAVILDNNVSKYKKLQMDDLKRIDELIIEHHKLVLEIDVAGHFDHTFTLYNTTNGIYIVDSYLYQKKLEKRPFDLNKLYQMLIDVDAYINKYEQCECIDGITKTKKYYNGTSIVTFNECAKIWNNFWDVTDISGASGNLDYYTIKCYHS